MVGAPLTVEDVTPAGVALRPREAVVRYENEAVARNTVNRRVSRSAKRREDAARRRCQAGDGRPSAGAAIRGRKWRSRRGLRVQHEGGRSLVHRQSRPPVITVISAKQPSTAR